MENCYFHQCARGTGPFTLDCCWIYLSSKILDDRVHASAGGSRTSSQVGGLWACGSVETEQQTPCCSLPYQKSSFFFLLKSETYQIVQFTKPILLVSLPSFQKEWKFVKYACSLGERGGIKLQTVLLKTAWAAFVWTFKMQQLNTSIVRRGKYANSKHISHQKPFQPCHRWDMKDDKSREKGEACIMGVRLLVIVRGERGWIGLTSPVTREAPWPGGHARSHGHRLPLAPPGPPPCQYCQGRGSRGCSPCQPPRRRPGQERRGCPWDLQAPATVTRPAAMYPSVSSWVMRAATFCSL